MGYLPLTFLPPEAEGALPRWSAREKDGETSFSLCGASSVMPPSWLFITADPDSAVMRELAPSQLGLPPDSGPFFGMVCRVVVPRKGSQILIFCDEVGDLLVVRPYDYLLASSQPDLQENADRRRQSAVKALRGAFTANCHHETLSTKVRVDIKRYHYGTDIFVLANGWSPDKAEQGMARAEARLNAFLQPAAAQPPVTPLAALADELSSAVNGAAAAAQGGCRRSLEELAKLHHRVTRWDAGKLTAGDWVRKHPIAVFVAAAITLVVALFVFGPN